MEPSSVAPAPEPLTSLEASAASLFQLFINNEGATAYCDVIMRGYTQNVRDWLTTFMSKKSGTEGGYIPKAPASPPPPVVNTPLPTESQPPQFTPAQAEFIDTSFREKNSENKLTPEQQATANATKLLS